MRREALFDNNDIRENFRLPIFTNFNHKYAYSQSKSLERFGLPTPAHPFVRYSRLIYDKDDWIQQRKYGYFYHYTSKESAECIFEDMKINKTKARIPGFGHGVFMTRMSPRENLDMLLINNYRGNLKYLDKLECAFAIKESHVNAVRIHDESYPHRDVWRSNREIQLNGNNFALIMLD